MTDLCLFVHFCHIFIGKTKHLLLANYFIPLNLCKLELFNFIIIAYLLD